MTDSTILGVGVAVFTLLGLGVALTLIEFRKMGDQDQNDDYPRTVRGWKRAASGPQK